MEAGSGAEIDCMNTAEPTGGVPFTLEVNGVSPFVYVLTSPCEHPGDPENRPAGGGAEVSHGGENTKLMPDAVTSACPELMFTVPITVAEAVVPVNISVAAAIAATEPPYARIVFQYVSLVKTVLSSLRLSSLST